MRYFFRIAVVSVYSFQQNPVDFTVLDQNSQMSTVFSAQTIETPPGPIKSCHIIVNRILDYETPPRMFNVKIRAQETNTNRYTDQDVRKKINHIFRIFKNASKVFQNVPYHNEMFLEMQ